MENEKNQDVETESLKLAIEQIADDETAALPHIEQLSSAVAETAPAESAPAESAPAESAPAESAPAESAPAESAPSKSSHRAQGKSAQTDQAKVSSWFFTFMCMNIPIIGWFYLFYLAFSKKKKDRRNFARAYLFYKLIFLVASLVILGVIAVAAMNLLEELLDYMQML